MKTVAVESVHYFQSSSNPVKQYETLRYVDGSLSCDCPGWTRRVASDGSRTCKHTRAVLAGQSIGQHIYGTRHLMKQQNAAVSKPLPRPAPAEAGHRRFDFD